MCPYEYRGCEWIGELREVQAHLEFGNCNHSGDTCTHCKKTYPVLALPEHEKACQWALVNCPNGCGKVGIIRHMLKFHRWSCKFELISCSNGCPDKVKRQDYTDHLTNVCGLRQKQCSYCRTIYTAMEYSIHEAECTQFPVECPNSCGRVGILCGNLATHRRKCKLELVLC